jgi:hypothetical protein
MGTHVEELADKPFLGVYSLWELPYLDVKIDKVVKEEVTGNKGKKEKCIVLYFKDGVKPMILNSTNRKTITSLLGTPEIEKWSNQKIRLELRKEKWSDGNLDRLRVANELPALPILDEKHPKWEQAKAALKSGSITLEQLKKNYDVRGSI